MFKIKHLKLNYKKLESTIYEFGDTNYIYGPNNVGKSLMLLSLDYALAKSQLQIGQKDGMDNVKSIELRLSDGPDNLYLLRTVDVDNRFFYKYSLDDEFIEVSYDLYKQEISNFLSKGKDNYLKEYFDYNEEKLTFRAFTLFNFLDEKGLGNLSNIFSRVKDYEHQRRVRALMTFLYNYRNVHKICELKKKEKEILKVLEENREKKIQYNYFYGEIIKFFHELNLSIEGDIKELKARFIEYKNNFSRDVKKRKKGDLNELIKISYALSEELKYQESLSVQSQNLISRNSKANMLLRLFSELAKEDAKWAKYIKEIQDLIEKNQNKIDVLSIKDYQSTINEIKAKKDKIDRQISQLSLGLQKIPYESTIKIMGILERAFQKIAELDGVAIYDENKVKLENLEAEIKRISKDYDDEQKKTFDKNIAEWYKSMIKVDFVKEDIDNEGFSIDFNPIQTTMVGMRVNNKGQKIVYSPGSMARETTWQILAYLANIKTIIDNFDGLPFMRVLLIDGINQPFDEKRTSFPEIFAKIKEIAEGIGIQLFVASTISREELDNGTQIDLTDGFNKAHALQIEEDLLN